MEGIPVSKLQEVLGLNKKRYNQLCQVCFSSSPDTWREILCNTTIAALEDVKSKQAGGIVSSYFNKNVREAICLLDSTVGDMDILSAWKLIRLSVNTCKGRDDLEIFLTLCHMLAAANIHGSAQGKLSWQEVYSDTTFNAALASQDIPKVEQAKHYIKMGLTCSPLLLKDTHTWGNPPPSLFFLMRAVDILRELEDCAPLFQYALCNVSYCEELLDLQSKLCWVEDPDCENHYLLLYTLKQMRMLAFLTPPEMKKLFSLPPRLYCSTEICIRHLRSAERDEFALQVLKELWGLKLALGRDLGITNICINIGTVGVEGEARDAIVRITEGISDILPPIVPRSSWLKRLLDVECI